MSWQSLVNSGRVSKGSSRSSATDRQRLFERNRDRLRRESQERNYQPRPLNSAGPMASADASQRWTDDWFAQGRASEQPSTPLPMPTSGGSGGGGGRSGGGGGGISGAAASQALANSLQAALGSRMFATQNFTNDRKRARSAVDADRTAMNSEFDSLLGVLSGFEQPYDYDVQAGTADPKYAGLLASQGVDPSAYLAEVSATDGEAARGATQARSMRDALAAAFRENQMSRQAEVGQARTAGGQALSAEQRAMMQLIDERARQDAEAKRQERNAVIMQLISAMANNGQTVDVNALLGGK